ncbi:multidrug efflux pump subunit AcrB [Roseiarcus fermentans]|uniref:Multidrug efflux pump subunit AcrB n=1 Tax=Roseiarcus fermentans TaxID=1473586 RepID=A0A366EQC7_9HYPH|nr:efflux RND transporter permease subunit [Roseiarcus fermentans]RBP04156.1 multidrug efflux pump subunit AcrB [Roseiarcus fermentans]
MLAIVRIALSKPYTFVVMAMLIVIFGVAAAVRTPTDIFPNIGIPVVAVVWTYDGLPADDMSKRVIYYYERTLSTQVNDIEHIESQSLPRYGVVKVFFQRGVNINAALAQTTAASQTVLKYLPPGITPPFVLSFNASSVPVIQLALSSSALSQAQLFDAGQNFIRPQLASVAGSAIPSPYGGKILQVQVDIDQTKLQAYGLSAQDVVNAIGQQNIVTPVGSEKIGDFEYIVSLNGSPTRLDELNDLPIRVVNGATVFVRDVAYAHFGAPPQINMVRVDGSNAVLMTILKTGSASTLDVINGVKALLPKLRETLPPSLKLDAINDQSSFVYAAVDSVVFEGLVAAALTGLMILVFLGSWRSTLIITISIPLAILASVAALSAIGETINVMTLGGLALAVGILVDDATVTIENINWHLEQGKEIESAIMDGARQIVIPATVSLLCILIVFVPMFNLGGVAGYLFRPMAEAVAFALIASYVLSRTLVNTMARNLLAHQAVHEHGTAAKPTRNPLVRFQRGFERRFEASRRLYRDLLETAIAARWTFVAGFLLAVVGSFALAPYLGQNFFPSVANTQLKLHVRAPTGTRIEGTAAICNGVETEIRRIIPAAALGPIVDNIGLPVSGINSTYNNSGTVGPGDADILITITPAYQSEADDYVRTMREILPRAFPGTTFAFLPADIVSQILNFGLPAPIDVQVVGANFDANHAYANALLKKIAHVPGVADARIQQASNYPTLGVEVDRMRAAAVGLTEGDVAKSLQESLSGSFKVAPTFWINPKNGVAYPIVTQTPQYWLDSVSSLENIPASSQDSSQLVGGLATLKRGTSPAVVSHYAVQPVLDIYAATNERDLGSVSADIQRILDQTAKDLPRGSSVVMRGQTLTMTSAYQQLLVGIALAIVLIYMLIVVNFQSWLDPFVIVSALPTALAGIVWMLFVTRTTLSVPALTGAIMCMGVATANSILVVSFARERLAEGVDAATAAMDAGFTRFRPVLMTAMAMIIGMLPMALSSELNAPLGRAVIGGLLCSTLATLFFVPAVFRIVHDRRPVSERDPAHTPAIEATTI